MLLFCDKQSQINLQYLNLKIGDKFEEQVGINCKFAGHILYDKFTWAGHVEHICKKLASANFAINSTKNFLHIIPYL